jgi:hypothetical protein
MPDFDFLGGEELSGEPPAKTAARPRRTRPRGVLSWVVGTVSDVFHEQKEARIEGYVARVDAMFARQRQAFRLARAAAELAIPDADRGIVAERVYRRFLKRSWADAQITSKEKDMLAFVASALEISAAKAARLDAYAAGEEFKKAIGKALSDGCVDAREADNLRAIAEHTGRNVGELMQQFFAFEGDALLRSIFSQATEDGRLTCEDWKEFCDTASRLGISRPQMLVAIRQPARQLVEHALADARSDGEIDEREETSLRAILRLVIEDEHYANYVHDQIEEAKAMQAIAKGRLPSLPTPTGIAIRSGEIVHWTGDATFARTRETSRGTRTEEVHGETIITDTRMIFSAEEKSIEVSHRKILAHLAAGDEIEIRTPGKGAGRYSFDEDGQKAVAIWLVAIGRANQTITASDDPQARRRISREVRQRVWQRYGGRCAECNADTYLEFDHIIPVAKGGGNSETNVQLLCRKCNLAKSDAI